MLTQATHLTSTVEPPYRLGMDRRRFLLTSLAGALIQPLAAEAQQAGKVHRIGVLWGGPDRELVLPFEQTLERSLRELGYTPGHNIVLDYRYPETTEHRLSHAADLTRLGVDVIVASVNTTITPAKQATTTIPIVMVYGADPIGQGYIASLARPGGNITGLAWDPAPEFFGKFVEFLMQVIPGLSRLAGIVDAKFPATRPYWMATEAAARSRNIVLRRHDVQASSSFPDVLGAIKRDRAAAVIVFLGPFLYQHRREIAELAVRHRLPSVFNYREGPESGGFMSYGPDLLDAYRRAAGYIQKILNGAKPAELPVEQPTKFYLVINLKTAKALGLTIPPSLLLRADQVIE